MPSASLASSIAAARVPAPEASWSTDALPERDRFAWWREALCTQFMEMRPERSERDAPFSASLQLTSASDALVTTRAVGSAHRVVRGREEVARGANDHYFLVQQTRGTSRFKFAHGEEVVRDGSVLLISPDTTFDLIQRSAAAKPVELNIWKLPRRHLDGLLRAAPQRAVHFKPERGAGALMSMYLRELTGELATLDDAAKALFAQQFTALLAQCLNEHLPEEQGGKAAMRAAQLRRIFDYAAERLADPALSPARVSRALGISVRYIHRLFEPTGTTFSEWLIARRVELAHQQLTQPGQTRSVIEVAFACGFNSSSSFYRAFKQRYGVTPTEAKA